MGRNLSNHFDTWANLTSDKEVLNPIVGLKMDIDVNPMDKNVPKIHVSKNVYHYRQ